MENLERILMELAFFKDLDPQYVKIISGCASNVKFEAGEYLFHEGEEADSFYIVRQGKIAVEIYAAEKGSLLVDSVENGEILGWSWLIPPYLWRLDARATEFTRAIALDGKCLRTKCEKDSKLGYELFKRFAPIIEQRLQATRYQLLDLYGNKG
jgi:CRP/FNR family transcriptional regulator, cyclic AMP receptor protein